MIKLIITKEYEYVPKSERKKPKEEQTIFKLKTLTSEDILTIEDNSYDFNALTKKSKLLLGASILKRVELGLIGWSLNDSGADIPFTAENIKKLPVKIIRELSEELISSSSISDDEEKN